MLIIAIREVRRPAQALFWITINLILPIIGFGLYLTSLKMVRNDQERLISSHNESDTLPETFSRSTSLIAHALCNFAVQGLRKSRVQVLTNGIETFDKIYESIQKARQSIDIEYYIFRDDKVGKHIIELLIERAASGVKIRFIRDGLGSGNFPKSQIIKMVNAGIDCRKFFPVRFPWIVSNWNYRNHCKLVVIDEKEAFTGGINVGYEYTGLKPDVGFWRDTHVRIEGEAALDLQTIFNAHWEIASSEKYIKEPVNRIMRFISDSKNSGSLWSTQLDVEAYVQTLHGNPGISTQVIREAFFILITQATRSVDISAAYFMPDEDIIIAIKTAVARGVRIRLLLPAKVVPANKIVSTASRTYYGELLEAGVQIYLYKKGILHTKLMIIDREIAEIGAANYDLRSFRLNYEICEVLYSTDIAHGLTEQFEHDLTDSIPLGIEDIKNRTSSQYILEQGARLLSTLL